MIAKTLIVMFVAMGGALPARADAGDPIEPNAGNWRTWVISSGRDYRVPPPPGAADTQKELRALADLIGHNDAQTKQQIAFWDAQKVHRLPRCHGLFERPRIRQADVLDRHPYQPPRDVHPILARLDHPRQPVE